MNEENEMLGYGQYLKQQRLEKNIALEQVSLNTRISVQVLELIEQEKSEALPEDLFVRNFIRLYAKAIGIDPEAAAARFTGKTYNLKNGFEGNKPLPLIGRKLKQYLIIGVVVVTIAAAWLVMTYFGTSTETPAPTVTEEPDIPAVASAIAPDVPPAETAKVETPAPETTAAAPDNKIAHEEMTDNVGQADQLLLHVRAVEKTWLKVIVDGQRPIEYMLDVDEQIDLGGTDGFDLLIGNAGGIRITLNGAHVNIPGRSGQVVSMKIP